MSMTRALTVHDLCALRVRHPARAARMIGVYQLSPIPRWKFEPQPWPGVWGKCLNWGPTLFRVPSAASYMEEYTATVVRPRKTLRDFYTNLLCGPKPPPPAIHPLVAAHEVTLGITGADIGLVVAWHNLSQLKRVFPHLRVRHFDTVLGTLSRPAGEELCRDHNELRDAGCKFSLARTRYSMVVDTTNDAELWQHLSAVVDQVGDAASAPVVDILVCTQSGTVENQLAQVLADRAWVGGTEGWGGWLTPGKRKAKAAVAAMELVIAPYGMGSQLHTHRIPVGSAPWPDAETTRAAAWQAWDAMYAMANSGCDWIVTKVPPKVWVLQPHSTQQAQVGGAAGVAAVAGTGAGASTPAASGTGSADTSGLPADVHTHALSDVPGLTPEIAAQCVIPCSAERVLQWIDTGAVVDGRIALVDARFNEVARLSDHVGKVHYCVWDGDDNCAELLADTRGATDLVFFCNRASSNSPSRAATFQNWLKTQPLPEAGTPPYPRVRLLQGGMQALVHLVCERFGDAGLRERFKSVNEVPWGYTFTNP